jgi:hypothetical protein
MALSGYDLDLLVRLKTAAAIGDGGAVMEIGAQQLANSFLRQPESTDQLRRLFGIAAPFRMPPAPPAHDGTSYENLAADAPHSIEFWNWLGFDYSSIDIDGSPGAIPLDLNYDDAPPETRGKFDLVVNAGTTEHVANQVNAFKVIHDLTCVGGLMIHNLPSQGMPNHGLINYNPKFFWMLGRSNGYQFVYFNFHPDTQPYPLPANITDESAKFRHSAAARPDYRLTDAAIIVALRKRFDTPFVPPIDVNTGARTTDDKLRDRYWTVFKPDAFVPMENREWCGLGRLRRAFHTMRPGLGIGRAIKRIAFHIRRLVP